jgi:hypothetical protein
MTFEELIAIVREWQSRMTPDQARAATEELAGRTTIGLGNLIVGAIDADALWCFAASDKPAEQADPIAFLRRLDPPPRKPKRHTKAARAPAALPVIEAVPLAPAAAEPDASPPELPPKPARRGKPNVAERARKLLRQHLRQGPKPGSQIEAAAEAAEIPERTLIKATDALKVRTQRGRWWLPG